MDRRGPGKIVLAGFPLIAAGLGIFTIGVARHADYAPMLMAGLLLMGMGMGCVATPLSAACVQPLAPHQIARGATLRSVNNQLGGAVGAALMTVLLTNQLIHEDTGTASGHLVHAYTLVFAAAAAVAAIAIVAAAFLPATADDAAQRGQPDERPSARPMRKLVA